MLENLRRLSVKALPRRADFVLAKQGRNPTLQLGRKTELAQLRLKGSREGFGGGALC